MLMLGKKMEVSFVCAVDLELVIVMLRAEPSHGQFLNVQGSLMFGLGNACCFLVSAISRYITRCARHMLAQAQGMRLQVPTGRNKP